MLDLTKKVLPKSVKVGGIFYPIKTDFRAWLCFLQIISNKEFDFEDFDWFYTDEVPQDREEGFLALKDFCFPEKPLPRSTGNASKVLDYTIDSDLIYSAFREQYGIDLLSEDMHWHVFSALMDGLHGTYLNEVMQWRSWESNDGTKYEDSMQRLKDAWTLEGLDDDDSDEEFNNAFSEVKKDEDTDSSSDL